MKTLQISIIFIILITIVNAHTKKQPKFEEKYSKYSKHRNNKLDLSDEEEESNEIFNKKNFFNLDSDEENDDENGNKNEHSMKIQKRKLHAIDNKIISYQKANKYQAKSDRQNHHHSWKQDLDQWEKFPEIIIKAADKSHKNFIPTNESPEPPPPSEAARMARYVVHNSDWTTVATISTMPKIQGYPFANILSVSDGSIESTGSGVPYLYLTPLDFTPRDLSVNRRCSLTMSLAETDYCKKQSFDPEDPRCSRVTLSGEMFKIKNGSKEEKLAENALFTRHPIMKEWPKDHGFFFATLKINQIVLLDYFGGAKYISVKDYFRATP